MKDFRSSAEDSQVSQSDPEIVGNTFLSTNVSPEVCSTDDDDKFSFLTDLRLSTSPTGPSTQTENVLQEN